ncbi:hypothetical protein SAMN04487936_10740 [Halobacillus dabanensis]|uniref:LppM domain-containing protein n=1 Tax=Halobacillus dabanensis TaxID=240302 RepID=A0A1I3WNG7_HALDA|nr:hypothetical protein [Halobacillus dabanensis]SFK08693.1 hypothetical protein SAMN04487936_10740 [Halobacillus dabanensis]
MQRKRMVFSLILLLLFLTACVEGDLRLKVNKDGSGEHTVTIGVDEETVERFGSRAQGMIESANQELEAKGYEVEPYEEDGYIGFRAIKSFDDIQEMDILPVSGGLTEAGASPAIGEVPVNMTTESGIFINTYKAEAEIDLSNSGVLGGMQTLVADQLDLSFTLDLPISPKSHNADRVEGNVLQWDIQAAGTTDIMVEMNVPNVRNIAILVGCVAVVIGIISIWFIRKHRNKKFEK